MLSSLQLAVVGVVRCSVGKQFSEELAHLGITITSGLAIGIDGVAHRGALEARGKTIGVLGNGLGAIYPRRHHALAGKIVDSGEHCCLSFPLQPPVAGKFPSSESNYQRTQYWRAGD